MNLDEMIRRTIGPPNRKADYKIRHEMISTIESVGCRLCCETLDSYVPELEGQKKLLQVARGYASSIREHVKQGTNLILYGNVGTGKDHVCMGLTMEAFKSGIETRMMTGCSMRSRFTEAITEKDSVDEVATEFCKPSILWISDPVDTIGTLNTVGMEYLYGIVDARYRNRRPIWITMNASSLSDAYAAIGKSTFDRLRGGAVTFYCDWNSYRTKAK